jgi:hypothetical protein
MPKISYVEIKMGEKRLAVVGQANAIIEEYAGQGFVLTLRQLYYQFVARDLLANKQSEYKRLGDIVNDGRLSGLIDWNAITDRTRNLQALPHWSDPSEIVASAAEQFRLDKWGQQPSRIEVWIEKDALVGVIEGVCQENDVPFFSCRGYTSQSELWGAAQRLRRYEAKGQRTLVLHLGDHDPSGIDMSRDIQERLRLFGSDARLRRIALNADQVEEYNPPPNPAKTTDSRFMEYMLKHGPDSWELDALEPAVLEALIREHIVGERDDEAWDEVSDEQDGHRNNLTAVAKAWDEIVVDYS